MCTQALAVSGKSQSLSEYAHAHTIIKSRRIETKKYLGAFQASDNERRFSFVFSCVVVVRFASSIVRI